MTTQTRLAHRQLASSWILTCSQIHIRINWRTVRRTERRRLTIRQTYKPPYQLSTKDNSYCTRRFLCSLARSSAWTTSTAPWRREWRHTSTFRDDTLWRQTAQSGREAKKGCYSAGRKSPQFRRCCDNFSRCFLFCSCVWPYRWLCLWKSGTYSVATRSGLWRFHKIHRVCV